MNIIFVDYMYNKDQNILLKKVCSKKSLYVIININDLYFQESDYKQGKYEKY